MTPSLPPDSLAALARIERRPTWVEALVTALLPLAGVLVTAVAHEGRLAGPDLDTTSAVAAACALPVTASGGIASPEDLRALAARGARAAVLGMALYTGALDARAVAEEFHT